MEELNRISYDQFEKITENKVITKEDRLLIQSFVGAKTLVESCSQLKNEEIKEIHKLEIENIFRFVNVANIFVSNSEFSVDSKKRLFELYEVQQMVKCCNENFKNDEVLGTRTLIYVLIKSLLSANVKIGGSPAFKGKMPQKLFQFRQQAAEEWYEEYVRINTTILTLILTKLGSDEAMGLLWANTAYYLNKSQTYRFYPNSSDTCDNDRIYTILRKFVDIASPDNSDIINMETKILYKDL